MHRFRSILILVLVVLAVLGLHYRYELLSLLNHYRYRIMLVLHPQAAASADKPDVLYTWVDKQGVTHFEQTRGSGARVEYDGKRITPLAPVDQAQLAAADAATAADEAARAAKVAEPAAGAPPVPSAEGDGSQLIHQTTRELHQNIQKMREARAAQDGL